MLYTKDSKVSLNSAKTCYSVSIAKCDYGSKQRDKYRNKWMQNLRYNSN